MNVDLLMEQARIMLRLVGPRVSAAQDENIAIRKCRRCTPPPPIYTCYICGATTEDRWQFDVHVKIDPETCQRYAKAWAKRYSEME